MNNVHTADDIFSIGVTLTTGFFRVEQWAMHIVGGILRRAVTGVWHVTICAGDARIIVSGASREEFIFRMLSFEHGRIGFRIYPIFESNFFIIGKYFFDLCAIVPREGEVFSVALEIIFNVAVRANNGPHFLAGKCFPIFALTFKGFLERRVGHDQTHGSRFVAV